jgi:hypothetical protein
LYGGTSATFTLSIVISESHLGRRKSNLLSSLCQGSTSLVSKYYEWHQYVV